MKLRTAVVALSALVLISALSLAAQELLPASEPLRPIEFLVGAWHAEAASPTPNQKPTMIDSHIYWSDTQTAIFFVTRFNGKPHYSGMYAFDPATKAITFWYVDSDGNSSRGTVRSEKRRLIHEFTATGVDGKQDKLISYIDRDANDHTYHWQVLREGNTKPLVQLDYTRTK